MAAMTGSCHVNHISRSETIILVDLIRMVFGQRASPPFTEGFNYIWVRLYIWVRYISWARPMGRRFAHVVLTHPRLLSGTQVGPLLERTYNTYNSYICYVMLLSHESSICLAAYLFFKSPGIENSQLLYV